MTLFGRKRLKEFAGQYERPVVLVALKGDQGTYDGVLWEVLDDAIILWKARLAKEEAGQPVEWHPTIDGMLVLQRQDIQHVIFTRGGPG